MTPAQPTIEEAAGPTLRLRVPESPTPSESTSPSVEVDPDVLRRSWRCPVCNGIIPKGTTTPQIQWLRSRRSWAHLPDPLAPGQCLPFPPSAGIGGVSPPNPRERVESSSSSSRAHVPGAQGLRARVQSVEVNPAFLGRGWVVVRFEPRPGNDAAFYAERVDQRVRRVATEEDGEELRARMEEGA